MAHGWNAQFLRIHGLPRNTGPCNLTKEAVKIIAVNQIRFSPHPALCNCMLARGILVMSFINKKADIFFRKLKIIFI